MGVSTEMAGKGDSSGAVAGKEMSRIKRMVTGLGMETREKRALWVVKMMVFLDMVGVGLFVPLLSYYWKDLGVRPELLGFVQSTYQLSQICSGIVIGWIGDHVLGRKNVLLLSLVGSAVSYTMAAMAWQTSTIWLLVASRVVVGLVKQTMTFSRAVITALSSQEDRTQHLSHLRASATLAFMIGPTIGGLLSKNFDRAAPAYAASALFLFNAAMIAFLLPTELAEVHAHSDAKKTDQPTDEVAKPKKAQESMFRRIRSILSDEGLGRLTLIKFVNSLFQASLMAAGSRYVADKYALEPHHMGYLSSFQSIVSLANSMFGVAAVARFFGEERTLHIGIVVATCLVAFEAFNTSVYLYLLLIPFRSLASDLISQMFEVIFTDVVPEAEMSSALGTLGLLKAIARVCGPIYGGFLMGYIEPFAGSHTRPFMEGSHNIVILLMLLGAYPMLIHSAKSAKDKLKKE